MRRLGKSAEESCHGAKMRQNQPLLHRSFQILPESECADEDGESASERRRIAAYSVWHERNCLFLLLVFVMADEAATLWRRLDAVRSPGTSIVLLGVFDELPLDLACAFGRIRCPRSLDQAEEMALEPWYLDVRSNLVSGG